VGKITGLRDLVARSLRIRLLILVIVGAVAVAAPAYMAFNWIVASTIVQLGTLFAEKQVLYDRHRGLDALMREVALSETLAGSQAIRDWATNEDDPVLKARGIAELEHFRQSFADGSYFFVINESGHYYFNDAANAYAGNQYRYTVSADNPRDAWYFSTVAMGEGCHLNVDNDANLRVTKVWLNCVIHEGRRVLGVLGTGLDLTSFIQSVVNIPQVGVTSMFVDRRGAVQAHRDENLVDLRSLTAEMSAKRTVFSLVDKPSEQAALRHLMDEVAAGEAIARSRFLTIGGKQKLVGVGYLDRLGWFNVTLMDIDAIIDRQLFLPIGLLLLGVIGAVAGALLLLFRRQVLDRLKSLEGAVRAAQAADYGPAQALSAGPQDEVGRLSEAFTVMAQAVSEHTRSLEQRVRERTEALEALAFRDGLTGIANRRGFVAGFAATPSSQQRGLVLIDIDHFKTVNDTYGHVAGDAVIVELARRIADSVGLDNVCARWGGDEFIVLLQDSAPHLLGAMVSRLMAAVAERPIRLPDGQSLAVTVSVGACAIEPGESLDVVTEMADAALYVAKKQGRNRANIIEPGMAADRPIPAVANL
jgi:diguanylate cyclase (GGDEF)-like protein